MASSVTIEVTADGAGKIALARNIGTLSLATARLRRGQFRQGRADDDRGFRGIGFGGCGECGKQRDGGAAVKEPEGPKFKTVIVTRGLEQQSYQVVAPSK